MKVKIFKNFSYGDLEKDINEFIEDKSIEDIKFIIKDNFYYGMVLYSELKRVPIHIDNEYLKDICLY